MFVHYSTVILSFLGAVYWGVYLQSKNNIIAVKILNTKTKKYELNKKIKGDLHLSLSQSFFNDFSNFYLQKLAVKHKLKRNYTEIDKFISNQEIIN